MTFIRATLLTAGCLIGLAGLGQKAAATDGDAAAAVGPNIILIFADDLGWQEPAFAGSDFSETPHLDRLAAEGMYFRQAYSSAGNCLPSRACLMSGQYTPRHGAYAVGSTRRGPVELMRLEPIPNTLSLPLSTVTLGEALKGAGYATAMFGKSHLTDSAEGKSEWRGFDVVGVSQHGLNSTDPDDPKAIFSITSAACEFIESHRDHPFFVYLPHYAIHSKLQARSAVLEHFQQKPPGRRHDNPLLAACLAELDAGVGILLDTLKRLSLEENTVVVFTSDNGGTGVSQEPLRGKKGCYYEGGIRVPLLVRWPGVVTPGSTCDIPVINVDLFPTFAEIAGAEPPGRAERDGASLVPLLKGQPGLERTAIFWHFPGYLDSPVPRGRDPVFRTRPVTVIRKGDWKLHLYHEEWQLDGGRERIPTNRAVELYHMVRDPGEEHDLAASHPRERDELLDDLLAWMNRVGAQIPSEPNPLWQPEGGPGRPARKRARP
jgi:arylsulfatase A-like enzyme